MDNTINFPLTNENESVNIDPRNIHSIKEGPKLTCFIYSKPANDTRN